MDDLEAIQVKQLGPKLELIWLVHNQDSQSRDWAMVPSCSFYGKMNRGIGKSAKVAESRNFEPVVIVQVMIHIHYYSLFWEKFRENFSFFSQRQDYIITVAHGPVP